MCMCDRTERLLARHWVLKNLLLTGLDDLDVHVDVVPALIKPVDMSATYPRGWVCAWCVRLQQPGTHTTMLPAATAAT